MRRPQPQKHTLAMARGAYAGPAIVAGLVRQVPDEIHDPLLEWVYETATDPETSAPFIDASFEIEHVFEQLIGPMPTANPPTSGRRTYTMDLKFRATPEADKPSIDAMLAALRASAEEDPRLAGRLPSNGLIELGGEVVEDDPKSPRGGPTVTLQARVSIREPEPSADDEPAA
jgi:hypothetical protein